MISITVVERSKDRYQASCGNMFAYGKTMQQAIGQLIFEEGAVFQIRIEIEKGGEEENE